MTPRQQTAVNNFRRHVNVLVKAMSWSATCNGPNLGEMEASLSKFDEAAFLADLTALRDALGVNATPQNNPATSNNTENIRNQRDEN